MDERDIEMTDSDASDVLSSSTDLNKPINSADTDSQNYYEYSQDLFDDTIDSVDNSPCINFDCSQIARVNSPRITDLTFLTQTPKFSKDESSPCHPTIPTIPKSLVPFISTVNESWNSDLETPQAKTAADMNLQHSEKREQLSKSCETMERRGLIPDVTTPSGCFLARVENEDLSTSPILKTMIKRRRPKRRILKSLIDAKEITNVRHNSACDIKSFESSTRNVTMPVDNTTLVIDENCSLHNSNIHLIGDQMNSQDLNLIGNDEDEFLMNKRLQSCEDLGVTDEVVVDSADTESSRCKIHEKSLADLVEEIEELEVNKDPVAEHKYADIPMDLFTKDAKALENAKIIPMKPPNISNVKRQWGLISFTEMCVLEQENCENEDPRIDETENTDSTIKKLEFCHNPQEDKLITDKSATLSFKEDKDMVDMFSTSFSEKDEPVIDVDEFSPWFYQSNEIKSELSNNTNNVKNFIKENAEGVKTGSEICTTEMAAENNKLISCTSNFTPSKAKIRNNAELCIKGTAEDGENSYEKVSKGTASSRDHVADIGKMLTNLPQLHSSIGFSTASGKPIIISEDKMRKAAKLYDEIALQDGTHCDAEILCDKTEDLQVDNKENKRAILGNSNSSVGFSTAGGKPIRINEEKLKMARKLYEEIALQDKTHCNAEKLQEVPRDQQMKNKESEPAVVENSYCSVGFSTASGKPIKISEDKLKKAENIYEELALQDKTHSNAKILPEVPRDQRMRNKENEATIVENSYCLVGFSTASGKPIKISEDKLKKAAQSYEEITLKDIEQFDAKMLHEIPGDHGANKEQNKAAVVQNSHCSVGFAAASEKPMKISEQKLKAAEGLYNEINLTDNLQLPIDPLKVPVSRGMKRKYECNDGKIDANLICGAGSSVGFKTACGKPLIISEMAMKKAKMMYQSLDISESQSLKCNELTKESTISVNDKDSCKLQSLSTAAHQKLNINTEIEQVQQVALENLSKASLRDNSINEVQETDNARNQRSKIVIQQDQSPEKYHCIDHTINTGTSIPTRSISSGFSTAGGKAIKISNEALSNARNLLAEDENHLQSNFLMKTVNKDASDELLSNNNKVMKTSEDSLLKVGRLLFTEQENTPPPKTARKRNNSAIETPESGNASVSHTSALKLLSENILSDNTPLGVSIFQTSKRVRFNPDLQARKLFGDTDEETEYSEQFRKGYETCPRMPLNSSNYARRLLSHDKNNASFTRNSTTGLYTNSEMFDTNDRLMVPKLEAQTSWPLNKASDSTKLNPAQKNRRVSTYSDEITASTEALLADEENSLDGKSWASVITCSPTLIEDRDISTKPIISDAELPPSPIIGAKFRSRRKNRRSKKKTMNKGMGSRDDVLEEQIVAQDSQPSSGIATPSSDSSKESHRSMSTVIETALVSELEKLGETSSRVQFFDNQSENSEGVAMREIDDQEAIDYFSENHIAARLKQEKEIRAKKKCKPKPMPGSLLLRKSKNRESRVSWHQAVNGVSPKPRTACELMSLGIAPDVMEVTAASALDYRFKCIDFYSKDEILSNAYGLETGDGGRLIFNGNGYAGVAEFEQAFLASPGVDPTLVPLRWVENHYRWIVWKLASMDRMKFGNLLIARMLTPRHVMEQLKYRYDREIDKSQRPALRRIIEKDDPPNRRMVLCVATITKFENIQTSEKSPNTSPTTHWKVELTDGWYSITSTIDSAMSHLIAFGKVREGTKLVTCRAELLNCEQGCFPLEIPGDAHLKIHTNSTRRAKWDTKLGYCRYSGPIPTSLSAILTNGGLIGKLSAIIARVYPIQFFEKTCSGQSVFRNNKCEDKAVMIYEKERQAQIDAIYAKARVEFEARNRKQSSEYSSQSQETSRKLCRNEWNDCDPDSYEQGYGNALEEAFRIEVEAKLRESLPPPRNVTSILKVRVMEGDNLAIITVWSPSEDIIDVIKEGNRVSIHNVQTTGRRSGELQLSAGRQSFVKPEEANVPSFPLRCLTSIPEVAVAGFNPPFGEFDTVGIVVSLGPAPHGMKNFEVINLAYPNPDQSDSAYLSILFWEGIGAHGFSDILSIGAIVACTNLQWRRGAPRTIPVAYSTEHSTFTRNPRQIYLRSAFDLVKSQITDPVTYVSQCAMEIAIEHQKKSTILRSPAVQGTPSKASPSAAILQDKFVPGTSPRTPQNLVNPKEVTPAKYSIQRRLEKLQWYGEPPELSPVALNHSSMKVNQKFVPPARTPDNLEVLNKRRELNLKK